MLLPRLPLLLTISITIFSCISSDKTKSQTEAITPSINAISQTEIPIDTTEKLKPDTFFKQKKNQPIREAKSRKIITTSSSIQEDLNKIDKESQTFIINHNADTTLYCTEGTTIKIRQKSFVFAAAQNAVSGDITISTKEYYKTADIVLANLSTHSNSDILETGGMIFIEAYSQGQKCFLKKGSTIDISFPYEIKKENMQLFSGNWDNKKINWIQFTVQEDTIQPNVEEIAEYPGGVIRLKQFLAKNLEYPDSLAEKGIGGTIIIDYKIDENGKAIDARIKDPSQQAFKDIVLKTFSKMPKWKPAKRNGIPIKSTFSQIITFDGGEGETFDTLYKADFEATINDTTINQIKTSEIRQYIFSSSKLGWINCDRFYNDSKQKIDLFVKTGIYEDIDIKLVFHSFKAIIQGDMLSTGIVFKGIPYGEKTTIVAIKKLNDTNFISLTESITNSTLIDNLIFEPVKMKGLKQKLEQLSTLK